MARKKKTAPKERTGPKKVAGPSVRADASTLPTIHVERPRPGFRYTSPSAVPPRSAAERRAHGCEETTYTTKKGERKTKFTGKLDEERGSRGDPFCRPTTKPCGDRQSCPVQLVWVRGKPHLRFCITQGAPGHIVQVTSPEQAERLAEEACKDWPKPKKKSPWPRGYFKKHAPGVVSTAQRQRPKSPWGKPGLGDVVELGPGAPAAASSGASTGIGFLVGAALAGFLAARAMRQQAPQLPAGEQPKTLPTS